jgi:cytoskeletal protein CcmA (bactofilin family)
MGMFSIKKGGMEAASDFGSSREGSSTAAVATMIAKGVTLEGNFASEGPVQIEGNVKGHVKTSASLVVGSESAIVADVSAESATIAGSIQGTVSVTSKLHLRSTAKIVGDIRCASISVDAGATISGKVDVGSSAK